MTDAPESRLAKARWEAEETLRDLVIFPTVAKERRLRDESTPEGRKIWADVEKAAARVPEGVIGTYVCPRCGKDEPHSHGKDASILMLRALITKHREAIDRLAAAAREEARNEWHAKIALHELRFHDKCYSPFKSPETAEEHAMVKKYWENY